MRRIIPLLAGLLSACATVPREAGFPDVARLASERSVPRVHWNQGGPEDEAAFRREVEERA